MLIPFWLENLWSKGEANKKNIVNIKFSFSSVLNVEILFAKEKSSVGGIVPIFGTFSEQIFFIDGSRIQCQFDNINRKVLNDSYAYFGA